MASGKATALDKGILLDPKEFREGKEKGKGNEKGNEKPSEK